MLMATVEGRQQPKRWIYGVPDGIRTRVTAVKGPGLEYAPPKSAASNRNTQLTCDANGVANVIAARLF